MQIDKTKAQVKRNMMTDFQSEFVRQVVLMVFFSDIKDKSYCNTIQLYLFSVCVW